jgi:6-methylsalicylate decarboxylase
VAEDREQRAAPTAAIDVHAHFIPAAYSAALERAGLRYLDGNVVEPPSWDASEHLAVADANAIATSLLSISSPGLLVGPTTGEAIELARRVNDEAATVVRAHPTRFGLLAALPLPDVDAALEELRRACDELDADGVSLLSNYDGVYLGDPRLEPLFEELSRRALVAVIHPTSPAGWEAVSFGRSRGTVEFMFDAARAVFNMLLSGTLERHAGVTLVIPHAGGVIPLLAERVDRSRMFGEASRVDVFATLRRQFYDLAGSPLPRQLPALLSLVEPSQLVYGSDYPFSPEPLVREDLARLKRSELLSPAELDAALATNALELFPRLRDARPA